MRWAARNMSAKDIQTPLDGAFLLFQHRKWGMCMICTSKFANVHDMNVTLYILNH